MPLPKVKPTIGRIVIYRTDGRNGLVYDLPAIVTVTQDTHPGNYPDGKVNPLDVPESDLHVHLTVFSPGGFGASVQQTEFDDDVEAESDQFPDAFRMTPGSGTYVEWNVPPANGDHIEPRTWRWPVIQPQAK